MMRDEVAAAVQELANQLVPLQPEERLEALREVLALSGICEHCGERRVVLPCNCTNDD